MNSHHLLTTVLTLTSLTENNTIGYTIITSTKKIMFLPDFVCLSVCVLAR